MLPNLIDKMREGRRSPAILKIALSNIRSINPDKAVLVFEGVDDVGVFEVWIGRCSNRPCYEPLPGRGKDQVLGFRTLLASDRTGLNRCVFFFIDRDFDDLKGHPSGDDLYMHGTYSSENVLAGEEVLESILVDELRFAADPAGRAAVLQRFSELRASFFQLTAEINFRLFCAVVLGIRIVDVSKSIHRAVEVSLDGVRRKEDFTAATFVELEREPDDAEVARLRSAFELLDPVERFRGKYALAFLVRFVELVATDRRLENPCLCSSRMSAIGNVQISLSQRSMAARSRLPSGLDVFLGRIVEECPCKCVLAHAA
ncbi:DUF4435 domain-containing protein [Luteimonas vadosa]|uniref:DUF4435 domain-containing protein n=1 Tax=Luteimonas vadosa TaxID=1165507 RepID=UPI0031EFFB7A